MLYTVTCEGPQKRVIKTLAAPKIKRQLVICMIKNPNPLPITCLLILLSKSAKEGLSCG